MTIKPQLLINSPVFCVGEAPGKHEMEQGLPFVGPAGHVYDVILERAGLDRNKDVSTSNVVMRAPDGGYTSECFRLTFFCYRQGKKWAHGPTEELLNWYEQLYADIEQVKPKVLVAMGNYALHALTGITPSRGNKEKTSGITKWRGSILPYVKDNSIAVVPVLHPASILHGGWKWFFPTIHDFTTRVVPLSKGHKFVSPLITKTVGRSLTTVYDWLNGLKSPWTIDLETRKGTPTIYCIGLGYYDGQCYHALSIPWNVPLPYWNISQQDHILERLRRLFMDNPHVVGQNIVFDLNYLAQYNIKAIAPQDLKIYHTIKFPELPHSLDFMISYYLPDVAYYKDESKGLEKKVENWEGLFNYNMNDCINQLRVWHCLL